MGKSDNIKKFGKQMVHDHTTSTKMLMKAAHQSGMNPPPPPLRPDQQQMISQLQAAQGSDFDKMYVQQQLAAHQEALQLHSAYAQGGSDPNVQSAARQIVPVVQDHLHMLQSFTP